MTTQVDYNTLTGSEQVREFNRMVSEGAVLGLEGLRKVYRFKDHSSGARRCEALASQLRARAASNAVADAQEKDVRPRFSQTGGAAGLVDAAQRASSAEQTQPDAAPAQTAADQEATTASDAGAPTTEETDEMAAKRKAGRKPAQASAQGRKRGEGPTLATYTEQWNALVPRAVKKGIKGVKHHSSHFESLEKAKARVSWLEKQLRA